MHLTIVYRCCILHDLARYEQCRFLTRPIIAGKEAESWRNCRKLRNYTVFPMIDGTSPFAVFIQ